MPNRHSQRPRACGEWATINTTPSMLATTVSPEVDGGSAAG